MPDALLIHYQLTKDLWRQFFEAHYRCDRTLRQRYLWGVACIVIACLGFGGFYPSRLIAVLLLATGLFGVLSQHLLVARSLRKASQHPFFGQELTVAISAGEVAVRSGSSGYTQPWGNFVGYRRLAPGFLLYHDKNVFFFIPAGALGDANARRLEQVLEVAGVKRL